MAVPMIGMLAACGLTGVVAGLLAGLLGVGGGLVIVPALVGLFHTADFPEGSLTHLAVGTSLATIVLTALSSVLAHHRWGAVRWPLVRRLAPGVVGGVLVGALLADALDAASLGRVLGVVEVAVAAHMGRAPRPRPLASPPGGAATAAAAVAIGLVSGLAGIGGGTMTVPVLVAWGVRVQEAIATSAAVGLPIAAAGTAGFVLTGLDAELPPGSLGYVYLPAVVALAAASTLLAPLGARLAHRLPTRVLRRLFAGFLALVGVRMLIQ